ncbi:MAG: hypothetical protein E7578_02050 [Ruminococcaceae bacterium]|nr:hypothetical protein [Oscillospiraceae bacterium]
MSRAKRIDKRSIVEKITDIFDIPSSVLPWGMDMELRNDKEIFVTGCTGISEYSDNCVIFCGKGMKFICNGTDFELYTFADGRVKLRGTIETVHIERG